MNNYELLNKMKEERNWSDKTLYSYRNTVKQYSTLNNMCMEELILEADDEEEQGIRMKKRTIRERLLNFRSYLIDNFSEGTYKSMFNRIKAVYTHYEIEIPRLPAMSEKHLKRYEPLYFDDLPDKELIKKAFDVSDDVMKALILFMASSGCARKECLSITLGMFFQACSIECTTLREGLNILKDNMDIIPVFRLNRSKTGNFYYTFCSHEAIKYIYIYLDRRCGVYDVHLSEQLFRMSEPTFSNKFKEINDALDLGKKGYANAFRSHMLRKYNATRLKMAGFSLDEVDVLQGRTLQGSRKSYFFENPEVLKEKYVKLLPSLCILDEK